MNNMFWVIIDSYSLVIVIAILINYITRYRVSRSWNKHLFLLITLQIIGLVVDGLSFLPVIKRNEFAYETLCILTYPIMVGVEIAFHWYFLENIEDKVKVGKYIKIIPELILVVGNIIWIPSIYTNWAFILEAGKFVFQMGYLVCILIMYLVLIIDLIYTIVNIKKIGKKDARVWMLYCLLPFVAAILTYISKNEVAAYTVTTINILIIYIGISIEKEKELVKKENELVKSQRQLMISQLQPHFLYNALSTIKQLCKNPDEVEEAIQDFSDYLRMNLNTLNADREISFDEELKHTHTYLWLEQKRFEERLSIAYDIETDDFNIPALTLQPIVENAVKHGICKREEGGTITITSKELADGYEINVMDDGVGFDVDEPLSTEREHIGFNNVRERLRLMCDGRISIVSQIGKGTKVTIIIPKK